VVLAYARNHAAERRYVGQTARSCLGPLLARGAFPKSATRTLMTDAARLLEAALQLAPRERAELVEALTASLDGSDLGEAWESEIRKRIADVDAGRVKSVPGNRLSLVSSSACEPASTFRFVPAAGLKQTRISLRSTRAA
jgi:putative addiction module component (TIGR02574 family)